MTLFDHYEDGGDEGGPIEPQHFGLPEFLAWHERNPHVFKLFANLAHTAWARGRRHGGIWQFAGGLRWETYMRTEGSEFKIPNGTLAYFARLLMFTYPRFDGFFVIRPLNDGEPDWTALGFTPEPWQP